MQRLDISKAQANLEKANAEFKNASILLETAKADLLALQAAQKTVATGQSIPAVIESKTITVTKSSMFKAELPPMQIPEKAEKESESSPSSPWVPSPYSGWFSS